MARPIQFIDLDAQRKRLGKSIDDAILRAVERGQHIMGPEVTQLEEELARFAGVNHAVSCANGTDAIVLALMAMGIRRGSAVICPSFTFAATAGALVLAGAIPVFCDVDADTFNLSPNSAERGIALAREWGLDVVGLLAVDLFGQPVDYDALSAVCRREGIWLASDAAQSFGAIRNGKRVGSFGAFTTTSFFPAKPLGCYGDGGAVLTDDALLAERLRSLRVHGKGSDKYENVRVGMNSRLDTIQAAILLEKLKVFEDEIALRNAVADRYNALMPNAVHQPQVDVGVTSSWAQYTVRLPMPGQREALQNRLKAEGIPSAVYYPRPLHRQRAYRKFADASPACEVADALSQTVLSLPMHPYLKTSDQEHICAVLSGSLEI